MPTHSIATILTAAATVALLSGCALETNLSEDDCANQGLTPGTPEFEACTEAQIQSDAERNEELHEELTEPHDVENAHRPEQFAG